MAGVSPKEIRNRIRSMEATGQITKAMEMVAVSKLRRAQSQLQASRPYFESLCTAINDILKANRDFSSPYLTVRPVKKAMYVVIAGDRGLAAGYNSRLLALAEAEIADRDAVIFPIGKKCTDYFRMPAQDSIPAADMNITDCFRIARQLSKGYLAGEFDEIHLIYTNFVSPLSQIPAALRLLPLTRDPQKCKHPASDFLYEPGCEEVFDAIVPEYLGGILYGALCESRASEHAARRTAMESAASNAEEMIADLRQSFNRIRQAAITQEITEIVAGS